MPARSIIFMAPFTNLKWGERVRDMNLVNMLARSIIFMAPFTNLKWGERVRVRDMSRVYYIHGPLYKSEMRREGEGHEVGEYAGQVYYIHGPLYKSEMRREGEGHE
jgi:hypothetical protein